LGYGDPAKGYQSSDGKTVKQCVLRQLAIALKIKFCCSSEDILIARLLVEVPGDEIEGVFNKGLSVSPMQPPSRYEPDFEWTGLVIQARSWCN
jgi:hypothetical protein